MRWCALSSGLEESARARSVNRFRSPRRFSGSPQRLDRGPSPGARICSGYPTAPNESENAGRSERLASSAFPARLYAHRVHQSQGRASRVQRELAPRVGLEPTTLRLTAACSTIELPGIVRGHKGTHVLGQVKLARGRHPSAAPAPRPKARVRVRRALSRRSARARAGPGPCRIGARDRVRMRVRGPRFRCGARPR